MARLRKNDPTVNTAPATAASAAAPAPRRTAAAPHKRSTAKGPANFTQTPEPAASQQVPEPAIENVIEAQAVGIESAPTREQIAALAYSYWVERNYAPGSPELDWLRAEAELRGRTAQAQLA